MAKFLFAILLILCIYAYATISSSSRADINHTIILIPQHIGQGIETVANKIDEIHINQGD